MKTALLTSLAIALLFSSCKKDDKPGEPAPPGSTQKYPVRFDMSGFDQSITEFGRTDSLPGHIGYLYYIVFTQTGDFVRKLEQAIGDENFGTFYDSLPAGRYRIALLASETPANLRGHGLIEDPHYLFGPSGDVFYRNIELDVNGAVNQTVSLNRIVSKLKLIFTDRIPYDARDFDMAITHYPVVEQMLMSAIGLASGGLATPHPVDLWDYSDVGRLFIPGDKGVINWPYEITVLMLEPTRVTVRFTTYATTGEIYATKEIFNVAMMPGKTTVLTGKGFDSPVNSDGVNFVIEDPEWAADTTLVTFN